MRDMLTEMTNICPSEHTNMFEIIQGEILNNESGNVHALFSIFTVTSTFQVQVFETDG